MRVRELLADRALIFVGGRLFLILRRCVFAAIGELSRGAWTSEMEMSRRDLGLEGKNEDQRGDEDATWRVTEGHRLKRRFQPLEHVVGARHAVPIRARP